MAFAFRCRNCGRLHTSADAGECVTPNACASCGKGVSFGNNGVKTYVRENWEVLADATPERLAELGLSAADVERHVPVSEESGRRRAVEEITTTLATLDKREADWEANRSKHVADHQALQAKRDEIKAKMAKVNLATDAPEHARLTNELDRVEQGMRALEAHYPGDEHAAHKTHLKAKLIEYQQWLDAKVKPAAKPREVFVSVKDGAAVADSGRRE